MLPRIVSHGKKKDENGKVVDQPLLTNGGTYGKQ